MRNLGGAIGIAACGILLNNCTNLHFLRLAEHLTPANTAMDGLMARMTVVQTAPLAGAPVRAHAAALREAQMMAYAGAFLAVAACFALAMLLVPFPREAGFQPVPAAHWRSTVFVK